MHYVELVMLSYGLDRENICHCAEHVKPKDSISDISGFGVCYHKSLVTTLEQS